MSIKTVNSMEFYETCKYYVFISFKSISYHEFKEFDSKKEVEDYIDSLKNIDNFTVVKGIKWVSSGQSNRE